MKDKDQYILMADIVNSRQNNQKQLMVEFENVVEHINKENATHLKSPLTITLGDEFQGIVKTIASALMLIIKLEEEILRRQAGFKLRYVLVEGIIDTPINHKIAYGMLGEGLSKARKTLQDSKGGSNRFYFELRDADKSKALNDSFILFQNFFDGWKSNKDHQLVMAFLELLDYKQVAEKLGKTRSQIWKREKSLKINQYIAIKENIHYIGR